MAEPSKAADEVEAKLLGCDEYSDLAVLSIDKDKVTKVAKLGDSDLITVGNTVFTVGSPMGSDYSGSVTRGIVSAKERVFSVEFFFLENVVQLPQLFLSQTWIFNLPS